MSSDLYLGLLNAAAFMLCVAFLAYLGLIIVPFLRHQAEASGDPGGFEWHFLIPCLDEGAVITDTIATLTSTFPGAQIWCIDDHSTDATPALLRRLARRHRQLHVVTRRLPDARTGKGAALNAGWAALTAALPAGADPARIVVGVLDADSALDPGALAHIAGPAFFDDRTVGAVQIQVRVSTRTGSGDGAPGRHHRLLVRLQDLEFSGPIAAMQLLRRRSASVGMGGNGQFTRLSVLNQISLAAGTPWHGALLEDLELGLHVMLLGHRTEYCHDAWVEQDGLGHIRTLVRQRSRWAQGSMQCMRYLGPILRSPQVPTAAAVEITYFLMLPWLQLLGGLVYLASAGVTIWYAFTGPGGLSHWLSQGAWGVLPLFVLFGLAPFLVWGPVYRLRSDPSLSRTAAIGLGAANWVYSYLHYAAVWWAFARMVQAQHDWKKTVRAADRTSMPDLAGLLTHPGTLRPRAGRAETAARHTVTGTVRFRPIAPAPAAPVAAAAVAPASVNPTPVHRTPVAAASST